MDTNNIWHQLYEGKYRGLDQYFSGTTNPETRPRMQRHYVEIVTGLVTVWENTSDQDFPVQIGRKYYFEKSDLAKDILDLMYQNKNQIRHTRLPKALEKYAQFSKI